MKFKFANQTDFLRSVTVGLIFIPYHFVCDVARKIVFMRRDKIEVLLLGATCFSGGVALVTLIYYFFINQIYLFDGKFPLIVPILSTAILFVCYAFFKESKFKLYDDLQDFVFLDSVLSRAVNESQEVDLAAESANESEVEIVDEAEITGEVESPTARVLKEAANAKASGEKVTPVFNVAPVSKGAGKTLNSEPQNAYNPTIENGEVGIASSVLEQQLQQALNSTLGSTPSVKAGQTEKGVTDASAGVTTGASAGVTAGASATSEKPMEALSKKAKKTLYKNKMLAAIKDKLDSIHPSREIPEEQLNRVCEEQVYLSESDFYSDSLDIDIDLLLFGA